jgi:hypothetical protein
MSGGHGSDRPKRRSSNDGLVSDADVTPVVVDPPRKIRSNTSVNKDSSKLVDEETKGMSREQYVSSLKGSEEYEGVAKADGNGGILLELPPSRDVSPLSNEDHMFDDSVPCFEPFPVVPTRRRRSMSGGHGSDRPKRRSSNDGLVSDADVPPVVVDPPRKIRSITPTNKGSSKMIEEETKVKKTKKKSEEKVEKECRRLLKSSKANSHPSMRDIGSLCESEATRKTEKSVSGKKSSKKKSAREDTEEHEHRRRDMMKVRSNSDPSLRDLAALIKEQAALIEKQAALLEEHKLQEDDHHSSSCAAEKKGIWRLFSKH